MRARFSSLVTVLFFGAALCVAIYGGHWLRQTPRFSLQFIQVHAKYRFVTPQQIQQVMAPYLHQVNFFSVPMSALEKALLAVPAVARVKLARKWPGRLEVRLWERQPVAVWNGDSLIDAAGYIFPAPKTAAWFSLPRLVGQKSQAKHLLRTCHQFQSALNQVGLVLRTCSLSGTVNWSLQLIPGDFWAYLGNRFLPQRMERLVGSYPVLIKTNPKHKIACCDLRYPQGLAVRWVSAQTTLKS